MRSNVLTATLATALLSVAPPTGACEGDGASFILRDADGTTRMIGSLDDLKRVRAAVKGERKVILWTRIDGEEYVISDPTTLARARAIFTRDNGLDAQREELDRAMDALHARQEAEDEELDAEEEALDRREEALDDEHDRMSEEMERDLTSLVRRAIQDGRASRP
jgi:hypothetical protein